MNLNVDIAIILCAGFGTRMGRLSSIVPKPLWPFFNQTLLLFQINQLKKMGIKKICINTHFHNEILDNYIKSLNDDSLYCFYEKELLGSGGGVTNIIKELDLKFGQLLVINSDAFIDFTNKQIQELIFLQEQYTKILIAIPNEGKKYNQFFTEKNILKNVAPPVDDDYYTYSGCGIFDISKLNGSNVVSSFFDTVANYRETSVYIYNLNCSQHFDFGTYDLFYDHIVSLKKNSQMLKFLSANGIRIEEFILKNNIYCFDKDGLVISDNIREDNIVILKIGDIEYTKPGIYYDNFIC